MLEMGKRTNDWLAALVCVAAGVTIAALPHFLAWVTTGRPDYVFTYDDRYFLAVASQAYFNHPGRLSDPVFVSEGANVYRALSFLPGVWAAKLFGLDPLGIGLMWRIFAGITIGLAWYVLFRHWISRPWAAASLSAILLSDPGLCRGLPFAYHLTKIRRILSTPSESLIPGKPWMHIEWRVVNPGMIMVYLIGFIWAVCRARQDPTRRRIVLAGLGFGLLFYVFFYYWTTAGLALLLALALDAGHRRVYFHVGWIGGLVGLPAIVSDFLQKQRVSPDFLHRCDRFLPIGRFTELEFPPEMLIVAVLSFAWVWFRRRDLLFVWATGLAGLMLANNQILTGLQFENWHWMFVWGPAFCFLVLLGLAEAFRSRWNWSVRSYAALGAVSLLAFAVGMWIRAVEATRCIHPADNARVLAAYRSEFPPGPVSRFTSNGVVGGDIDFVEFAAILDNLRPLQAMATYSSPSVSDADLDERTALNEYLLGTDRPTLERRAFPEGNWDIGPWTRDRSLIPIRAAARIAAYDRVCQNPSAALDRFAVRYVALPTGRKPDYLTRGWTLLAAGPTWDIWERATALTLGTGQEAH